MSGDEEGWVCGACTYFNPPDFKNCNMCFTNKAPTPQPALPSSVSLSVPQEMPPQGPPQFWTCGRCTYSNIAARGQCEMCMTACPNPMPRPSASGIPAAPSGPPPAGLPPPPDPPPTGQPSLAPPSMPPLQDYPPGYAQRAAEHGETQAQVLEAQARALIMIVSQ